MISEQEIISRATIFKPICGVYFLVKESRVIYVGQSVNINSRLLQHAHKKFDSYAYIECVAEELDALETSYILALRPPLNQRTPRGSYKQKKRNTGINWEAAQEWIDSIPEADRNPNSGEDFERLLKLASRPIRS